MTPKEFFDRIDYQQLVFQKEMLLNVMINSTDDSTEDDANSLIHLIDAIQDIAAEIFGEEKVFLFEKKAEYLLKYRQYINDNNLRDDSYEISTRALFNFVDYEIIPNEDNEDLEDWWIDVLNTKDK